MISFASVNGPSVILKVPSAFSLTRAPFELCWSPSVWMRTPDLASSSMNLPMAAMCSWVGGVVVSSPGLYIVMNRIWAFLLESGGVFCCLTGNARFLGPHFGGQVGAEIICFEHLPNLDLFAAAEGSALEPLDCFVARFALPQPEAGDQLFRLRERSIDDRLLAAGSEFHAHAFRRRLQSFTGEHHAGFDELFVEPGHLGENFLIRKRSSFGILVRLYYHHEPHFSLSSGFGWSPSLAVLSAHSRLY